MKTILVVDDDPQVSAICGKILNASGYRVLATNSPIEALLTALQDQEDIDLLLTDFTMPMIKGSELARAVEVLRPTVRSLLMSGGVVQPEVVNRLPFLPKPFSSATLVRKVREVLAA